MRGYIAAPWFTEEQETILSNVKLILDDLEMEYFSPKDENLWKPGIDPLTTLLNNVVPLKNADFVVVVTDGKDVGTMWEAGFAYANRVPIIYLWLGRKEGQKFNVMLAGSGEVAHSYDSLHVQLNYFNISRSFIKGTRDGDYE